MKAVISDEGKLDKYMLLVAQLIYVSNCLSDDVVPNYYGAFKSISKRLPQSSMIPSLLVTVNSWIVLIVFPYLS